MRSRIFGPALAVIMLAQPCFLGELQAADLYVYPAQEQSSQQQKIDQADCYQFGVEQTGFDPMDRPTATSQAPQQRGSIFGGAAKGALIGAVAGDAGKGAAIGGLLGGMRRNHSRREQAAWANQESQNYNASRNAYDRAYGACLEGRGYTVR